MPEGLLLADPTNRSSLILTTFDTYNPIAPYILIFEYSAFLYIILS